MPAWWWPNTHEPDRSIYTALKSSTIPVVNGREKDQIR
jgi:hypothetical protein